ncbi:MAG: hypothetical protein R2726_09965 [Acidimicrobiales bacterium]
MARRADLDAASVAVAARHPGFAALAEAFGPVRLGPPAPVARRFEALARHVAYQQLAGTAARAIWARVRATAGDGAFDAGGVLTRGVVPLRRAGLSGAKAATVVELAARVEDGSVRLDRIGRRGDDEVVAELTTVRGIGPWTAQMFLLFDLHRLDVWPTGDLGVRAGFGIAVGGPTPTPVELAAAGERFRPYRSVAAWYCWRAVEAARRS